MTTAELLELNVEEPFEDPDLFEKTEIAQAALEQFEGRAWIDSVLDMEEQTDADGNSGWFSASFLVRVADDPDPDLWDKVEAALYGAFSAKYPPDFLGNDIWWRLDGEEQKSTMTLEEALRVITAGSKVPRERGGSRGYTEPAADARTARRHTTAGTAEEAESGGLSDRVYGRRKRMKIVMIPQRDPAAVRDAAAVSILERGGASSEQIEDFRMRAQRMGLSLADFLVKAVDAFIARNEKQLS